MTRTTDPSGLGGLIIAIIGLLGLAGAVTGVGVASNFGDGILVLSIGGIVGFIAFPGILILCQVLILYVPPIVASVIIRGSDKLSERHKLLGKVTYYGIIIPIIVWIAVCTITLVLGVIMGNIMFSMFIVNLLGLEGTSVVIIVAVNIVLGFAGLGLLDAQGPV